MHFMCHIGYNGRDDIENDFKNLGDKIKAQKKKKVGTTMKTTPK